MQSCDLTLPFYSDLAFYLAAMCVGYVVRWLSE